MEIKFRTFHLAVLSIALVMFMTGFVEATEKKAAKPVTSDAPVKPGKPQFPDIKADDPRWVLRESGLKILHLKEGTGPSPVFGQKFVVGWAAWKESDKKLFDASDSGIVLDYIEGGSIKGWEEGLSLIKEGGHAVLRVPPELAYGETGLPERGLAPNEVLVFSVKLVKVVK